MALFTVTDVIGLYVCSVTGKLLIGLRAVCRALVSPDMCFSCPNKKFIPNEVIYIKDFVHRKVFGK